MSPSKSTPLPVEYDTIYPIAYFPITGDLTFLGENDKITNVFYLKFL